MTARCSTCRHFRPYRPLSQLLLREVAPSDPQIVSEMLKVMQDERQRRDEEASLKVEVYRKGDAEWPFRPCMSDYCGLHEAAGKYLVHEIKNAGGQCDKHDAKQESRSCQECCHRVAAKGVAGDHEQLTRLGKMKATAALVEGASDGGVLERFVEMIGSLKSLEIAQAYYAGRFTVRAPEYLATCQKRSSPMVWALCAVENPHDACSDQEAAASAGFMAAFHGKSS